jgi:hypothetical protein
MSGRRFFLGLAFGLFCSTSLAFGILIETKAGKVGGFLVSDDGTNLRIGIPTPDGQEKISDYPRADVKVLHQLDVKRLEGLSRANPKAYRDYADELARVEGDPEARYVALRLYLIAAYLAPEELGCSSLLRMSALASSQAEARKFRALAYLLDPRASPDILKVEAVKTVQPARFPQRPLEDFVKALQHYRAGRIKLAGDLARHEGVDAIFNATPDKVEQKTFLGWCNDASCPTCKIDGLANCPACMGKGTVRNPQFGTFMTCQMCKGKKRVTCPDCGGTHVRTPLPEEPLRAVLRCELWAVEQLAGEDPGPKGGADTKSWSAILQSRQLNPVLPLSLETITTFDPRKCCYRNRKWVEE